MTKTIVAGNTYTVKEKLKTLGFRWNAREKHWEKTSPISSEQKETLEAIRGIIIAYHEPGANTEYIENRTYKQRFGRCEDAPCCGCCGSNYYERGY